ncbi:unnamed protein product [Trichobilharzia regenti]|nr:unnamed protein product [Trichobilharzia regenti]
MNSPRTRAKQLSSGSLTDVRPTMKSCNQSNLCKPTLEYKSFIPGGYNGQQSHYIGEKLARVVDWLERKRQTGALQQTNAMLSLQSTSLENEIPSIAAAATAPPPPLSPILSRFSAPQPSCVVPVKNDVDDDTEMRDLSTSIEVSSPTSRGKGRFGTPTKSLKSLRSPLGAELTPKKSSSSTSSQNDTADISTKKSPKLENINVLEGNTDGNDSLGIASSDHVTSERTASPSTISENITPISPSRNSNNNKDEENTRINSPNIQITPAHNETSPVSSCSLFKPELQNEDSSLDDSLVKSVSSTSQLTSPTLSTTTDDHSNISLSPGAGSSRKRKRPVTRKRLIHEPELLPPGVEMISDDSSTCITTTTTTPHHHQIAELNTGRSIDEENLGGSSTSTANNNNNGQNMDESSSDKDLLPSTGVIVDQASEEHNNNKPCMHTCQSHLMLEYETCCLDIQPLGMMNLPSTEVIAETSCLSSVYEKPIIISDHHHEEPEQQQQSECIDDPMTSPDTTELSNNQPDIMDDSQVNSVKNDVVVISSEMVSTDNLDKRLDDETEVTKSLSKLQPDEEEEVGNNDDDDDHEEEDEVLDCSKTTRGLYDIEMFIPPSKDSEVVSSAAVTVPSSVPLSNENDPNSCVSIDKEELPPPTNEAMSLCMNISMLSSISDEEMMEPSTTDSIVDISPSKSSPLPPTITAASAAAPPPIHEKESKTLTKFAVETLVSDDYPTTSSATSNLLNLSYISSPDEDDGDDIASEKDSKDSPQLNTTTASTNDDDEMVMTTNTVEKLDDTTTTATTDMNKSLPESSDDNRCIITTDGNDDPMAQVGGENSISEQSIHPTISATTKDDEATAMEFMSTTVSPSHPGTPLLDEKSDPLEQTTSDFDTITSNTISIISNPECLQLITNSHEVIDAYTHTTTDHSSSSTPSSSSLASSSIVSKQQNLEILMKKSRDCSTTPRKDTEDTMVKKSKDSSRDYNRHYEAVATADRHHHSPSSSHSYYQSKSSSNFNHYKSQSYSNNNNNSNNPRYDRKHHYPHPSHQHQQHSYRQHQHHSHQLKDSSNNSSHRRDDYNSRYRDTPSSSSSLLHRSRDHDDKNSSAYSSSSRHNHHNERSSSSHSSSSHRHQDSIYSTSHRDSS